VPAPLPKTAPAATAAKTAPAAGEETNA